MRNGRALRGGRLQARAVLAAEVDRERTAIGSKNLGVAHQPLVAQPVHGLERGGIIPGTQRLDGGRAGDPRDARGAPQQVVAHVQQIHRNVRDHCHGKDGDRGHDDDHAQLSLDGKVGEPTNQ